MPTLSRTVRRFIMNKLMDSDAMSLVEIQEAVRIRFKGKDVPSIVSLSGGLRSPIFLNCPPQRIDGRDCAVIRLNRNLIRDVEDMTRVLSYSHLFENERAMTERCSECNQLRLLPENSKRCLRCIRPPSDI